MFLNSPRSLGGKVSIRGRRRGARRIDERWPSSGRGLGNAFRGKQRYFYYFCARSVGLSYIGPRKSRGLHRGSEIRAKFAAGSSPARWIADLRVYFHISGGVRLPGDLCKRHGTFLSGFVARGRLRSDAQWEIFPLLGRKLHRCYKLWIRAINKFFYVN